MKTKNVSRFLKAHVQLTVIVLAIVSLKVICLVAGVIALFLTGQFFDAVEMMNQKIRMISSSTSAIAAMWILEILCISLISWYAVRWIMFVVQECRTRDSERWRDDFRRMSYVILVSPIMPVVRLCRALSQRDAVVLTCYGIGVFLFFVGGVIMLSKNVSLGANICIIIAEAILLIAYKGIVKWFGFVFKTIFTMSSKKWARRLKLRAVFYRINYGF